MSSFPHDHVVLDEIELYGELIIAASTSDGPLTPAQIDAVLGIGTPRTASRPRPRPRSATGRLKSARGGRSPVTPP